MYGTFNFLHNSAVKNPNILGTLTNTASDILIALTISLKITLRFLIKPGMFLKPFLNSLIG